MHLALYLVLGLSIVVDLALGAWASVAWGSFASTWFPSAAATASAHEPQLLGLVLGLILIFLGVMQGLALHWIRKDREGGFHFVICFGSYLVVSSLVVFGVLKALGGNIVPLGGVEFLLIDGLRGAALVTLGLLAKDAPATVRELRIPEHARTSSGRTQPDMRSGGGRGGEDRGSQRRGGRGRSNRERNANRAPAAGSRNERSDSGGRDSRRERSGAAGSSQSRDRRNSGSRDNRRSRGESPERPRTAEATGSDVSEADRSLAVVVRGDFRGEAGGTGADDAARESGESGDRRRRRRGGRGRRRGGPGEAPAGDMTPGGSGSAPSSMLSASAPKDALEVGRSSRGEGLDMALHFDRGNPASDRPGGSEFGRSRRPAGARRK